MLLPSAEEALQFAYRQSQGHIPCHNKDVVLAMKPSPNNLVNHNAMRKTTRFQRGHSVQYLQVHSGNRYKMDEQEILNTRVTELDYNLSRKFDKYCWGLAVDLHAVHISMAQCGEKSPRRAILTQALEHLGQEGVLHFAPE